MVTMLVVLEIKIYGFFIIIVKNRGSVLSSLMKVFVIEAVYLVMGNDLN